MSCSCDDQQQNLFKHLKTAQRKVKINITLSVHQYLECFHHFNHPYPTRKPLLYKPNVALSKHQNPIGKKKQKTVILLCRTQELLVHRCS